MSMLRNMDDLVIAVMMIAWSVGTIRAAWRMR